MNVILFLLLVAGVVLIYLLRKKVILLENTLDSLEKERSTIYGFLDRLGSNITSGTDTANTMELIVDFAMEATKADAACLFVRDRDSNTLRARVVRGLFPPLQKTGSEKVFAKRKYLADIVKKITLEVGEGFIGQIAERGEPTLIPNVHADPRLQKIEDSGVEVRDLIAVPLIVRGDNLGVLSLVNKTQDGPFDEMDKCMAVAIADQAAVTLDMVRLYKLKAEQQRLEHELELARTFQSLLLPRSRPVHPRVVFADFYRPAQEVGGDYYDYVEIDEEHVGIAIGDVSGKGIPGALVMASVRATLRAEARFSLSPKKVLRAVNEQVARDTKENVFITVTYGVLNVRTGMFRFCRAGHEPVICCNLAAGQLTTHSPEGIALGLIVGELFDVTEEAEVDLSREKNIFIYTDGVTEAMNGEREEYGEERLHRILWTHAADSPGGIIEKTVRDIEDFTRGLPQHDDITMVAVGWKGEAGEQADPGEEMRPQASTA